MPDDVLTGISLQRAGVSGRLETSLLPTPEQLTGNDAMDLAIDRLGKAADAGVTRAADLRSVLMAGGMVEQLRTPVLDVLPKVVSRARRGKFVQAAQLLQSAKSFTLLLQQAQLPIAAPAGAVTLTGVLLVLSAIGALIAIVQGIKELAEAVEGSSETENWETWRGNHTFESKNIRIKKFACDSTIDDVDDGVVVIIDEIPKDCTVTISGNDGTIRIKSNKGTLVIEDNDDNILVDSNDGTVKINGNDDTIVIDTNNQGGDVTVNGNSDKIAVNNNNGDTKVNSNDDTVNVNKNGKGATLSVNANDDTVNVNKNDGTINVDGNTGSILDDADVNVVDNTNGTINVNNNDGDVNIGEDAQGNRGTVNKGNKPGDILKLS